MHQIQIRIEWGYIAYGGDSPAQLRRLFIFRLHVNSCVIDNVAEIRQKDQKGLA